MEALAGDRKSIALIAADPVMHFEKHVEAMDGKAMIVCMSRRISVDLFIALIKLRPEWDAETLKVVIVRHMWLTGFDTPFLHTIYSNKPMQGHSLTQAIPVLHEKHVIAVDDLHSGRPLATHPRRAGTHP